MWQCHGTLARKELPLRRWHKGAAAHYLFTALLSGVMWPVFLSAVQVIDRASKPLQVRPHGQAFCDSCVATRRGFLHAWISYPLHVHHLNNSRSTLSWLLHPPWLPLQERRRRVAPVPWTVPRFWGTHGYGSEFQWALKSPSGFGRGKCRFCIGSFYPMCLHARRRQWRS